MDVSEEYGEARRAAVPSQQKKDFKEKSDKGTKKSEEAESKDLDRDNAEKDALKESSEEFKARNVGFNGTVPKTEDSEKLESSESDGKKDPTAQAEADARKRADELARQRKLHAVRLGFARRLIKQSAKLGDDEDSWAYCSNGQVRESSGNDDDVNITYSQ